MDFTGWTDGDLQAEVCRRDLRCKDAAITVVLAQQKEIDANVHRDEVLAELVRRHPKCWVSNQGRVVQFCNPFGAGEIAYTCGCGECLVSVVAEGERTLERTCTGCGSTLTVRRDDAGRPHVIAHTPATHLVPVCIAPDGEVIATEDSRRLTTEVETATGRSLDWMVQPLVLSPDAFARSSLHAGAVAATRAGFLCRAGGVIWTCPECGGGGHGPVPRGANVVECPCGHRESVPAALWTGNVGEYEISYPPLKAMR